VTYVVTQRLFGVALLEFDLAVREDFRLGKRVVTRKTRTIFNLDILSVVGFRASYLRHRGFQKSLRFTDFAFRAD
jgi:hypothetical protein